jgi:hypothetical protein
VVLGDDTFVDWSKVSLSSRNDRDIKKFGCMSKSCAIVCNLIKSFDMFSELRLDITFKENSSAWLNANNLSGSVHYLLLNCQIVQS